MPVSVLNCLYSNVAAGLRPVRLEKMIFSCRTIRPLDSHLRFVPPAAADFQFYTVSLRRCFCYEIVLSCSKHRKNNEKSFLRISEVTRRISMEGGFFLYVIIVL